MRNQRYLSVHLGIATRSHREKGRGRSVGVTLAIILGFSGLVPALGQMTQDTSATSDTLPKINADGWTSAEVCGECHQSIFAVWRESLHSKAWSNPIFQASYRRCTDTFGKEQSRVCLSCHTPTIRHGNDFDVENTVTSEGITCDFCHSVSSIDLSDKADPFRITVGKTKYGPLHHAQSPAHETINSQLHTRSEFCATCHEYQNANGVTIFGTYSEWKQSSYAKKGKQCQDCHMPLVPGRVVALNVKRKTNSSVNLHDISGSHDIDRVRKAVTLDLVGYEWLSEQAWVYVKVANVGSGHCFPTGLPKHKAVLEVTIHNGSELVGRREIPFEVVMLDKDRRLLKQEHEILVKAASIRSDTRLKPDEVRIIDISFRNIKATRLVLNAQLYYMYSTEALVEKDGQQLFEPVEMKFLVASRRSTMKPLGH